MRSLSVQIRRFAVKIGSIAILVPTSLLAQAGTGIAPASPYVNRNLVVLDPAHGGQDAGAKLTDWAQEKYVTLALATQLRAALAARGMTVASTRDSDLLSQTPPLLTTDQRASFANHLRPVACLILHTTTSGSGVHIATSALPPDDTPYEPNTPIAWDTAQGVYVKQSLRLANDLGLALLHDKVPVIMLRTSVQPLDSLMCAAVVIEIAPLTSNGSKTTPVTDVSYQKRVVETISAAVVAWRDRAHPAPPPKTSSAGATP